MPGLLSSSRNNPTHPPPDPPSTSPPPAAPMERYKASIESVDTALNRLNQTLASYKLISAEFGKSSSASPPLPPAPSTFNKTATTPATAAQPVQPPPSNASASSPAKPATQPKHPHMPFDEQSPIQRLVSGLRSTKHYPENIAGFLRLRRIDAATENISEDPYCLPLYLVLATEYLGLGYPDVAAGSAYKALLLSDALDDEADEYHDVASDSLKNIIQQQPLEERIQVIRRAMDAELESRKPSELDPALDVELTLWLRAHYRLILYRVLTRSLLLCGCLRSALSYSLKAEKLYRDDPELVSIRNSIVTAPDPDSHQGLDSTRTAEWPDHGLVRREVYPWNELEHDRLHMLDELNLLMNEVSDKLEVRPVKLPALAGEADGLVTQLGVFAKENIAPGEEVLNETSLLTANNKLQDALCDACSADLPDLQSPEGASVISCPDCEIVFCSQWCYDEAMDQYHPALCGKDVEAIAKDLPPAEAADSLYSLLLLRTFALAETRELHPLDMSETKTLWGDFIAAPDLDQPVFEPFQYGLHEKAEQCAVQRTLPFSFEHNIRLPFHMLEKMDVDIFTNPQYDVWVFNTLYAKFRGTASARLSGLGGRAIRGPEVSAVHPMWCLANHSCDPNVSWEWGGSIKFTARTARTAWSACDGKVVKSQAGIRKDEEVLNHYCDIDLPVKERREWARGALGGDCRCQRCTWEAQQETPGQQ